MRDAIRRDLNIGDIVVVESATGVFLGRLLKINENTVTILCASISNDGSIGGTFKRYVAINSVDFKVMRTEDQYHKTFMENLT